MERSPGVFRATRRFVFFASVLACLTCNKTLDLSTPVDTPTKVTVTVQSNSVDPAGVFLRPGGQLTFDNRDSLPHRMVSACNELNTGVLAAGASVVIQMPFTNESCSYQDQTNANISGTVQLCTELIRFSCQ